MLLGAAAFVVFEALAEVAWDGRARSLVLPQIVGLVPAMAAASYISVRRRWPLWPSPLLVAGVFYLTWGLVFIGWNLLFSTTA